MASFRQHGNGWQARIRRRGYPDITKTFETKADAEKWARSLESEIDKGQFVSVSEAERTTLGDLIARYLVEVTPSMKGAAEDTIRLKAMMRNPIARCHPRHAKAQAHRFDVAQPSGAAHNRAAGGAC